MQPTTPTPVRLSRSAFIEQRIASLRRSASPRKTHQVHRSLTTGKEPAKPFWRSDKDLVLKARPTRSEKVAHADPAPKESGSAFVIPEKRPPRKKRNNTDIIEGLKSLKRKMPFQEPKLPLGRRETAELALEKRGSVKEHAKFFEEQARLASKERHPVRRTHTEKPAASILSKSLRHTARAAFPKSESEDRIDKAKLRHRAGSEKSPAKPRKPENFS